MRTHDVLTGMATIDESVGRLNAKNYSFPPGALPDPDAWGWCRAALQCAVQFDFGSIEPDEAHYTFGTDLLKRGVFRLPFDHVAFAQKSKLYIAGQRDNYTHFIVAKCGQPIRTPGVQTNLCIPFNLAQLSVRHGDIRWNGGPMMTMMSATGGALPDDPYSQHSLQLVIGLTCLLMGKDAQCRIEPAPERLNAARAKKGKPPIAATRVITLTPRRPEAATHAGSHSSPIMHWRRGHFRTLRHDRYGGERSIPVAPCLVGAGDNVDVPAPKDYVIQPPFSEGSICE